MLTKTGMLEVTQDELEKINKGKVPTRLKEGWGDDPAPLEGIVKSGEYTLIDEKNKE